MIDHFVDAAIYIHEALVDGYDLEKTYLDPAISVRDFMWPRFKNTKLSFVLNDSAKALEEAKLAKSESEVQAALAKLTIALRPWMLEGAPKHYQSRKVALFTDKESGRVWVQLQGKAINPYSRGEVEPIAWPDGGPNEEKTEKAAQVDANANQADKPNVE